MNDKPKDERSQIEKEVEDAIGVLFGKLYKFGVMAPIPTTAAIGSIVSSLNDMRLDIRIDMLRKEILAKKPTPESGSSTNTLN
jgi:hypothetical protein